MVGFRCLGLATFDNSLKVHSPEVIWKGRTLLECKSTLEVRWESSSGFASGTARFEMDTGPGRTQD